MDRIAAVKLIIQRHRQNANYYQHLAQKEENQAVEAERYLYELTKPGFRSKGWTRASKQGRVEPYVVHAHDTVTE